MVEEPVSGGEPGAGLPPATADEVARALHLERGQVENRDHAGHGIGKLARSPDLPEKKPLSALTPARYRPGLFSVDVSSISIKDANQQLEHPIFTLSKKHDTEIRKYEDGNGNRLEVIPSASGRPTIWDKDLLIFAISHIMDRKKRGEEISPRIRFHTFDVIEFCQRTKGGSAYARIDRALTRLAGALLKTNTRTGGIETTKGFHIIDAFDIKRQYDEPDDRLIYCEFTMSMPQQKRSIAPG